LCAGVAPTAALGFFLSGGADGISGKVALVCASAVLIYLAAWAPFLSKKPLSKPIALFSVLFYAFTSVLIDLLFCNDALPSVAAAIVLHAVLASVYVLNVYLASLAGGRA
jgi:hypothetical protein